MIHESHWERLASLPPEDVCRRTGAGYDSSGEYYAMPLLDRCVHVSPVKRTVQWSDKNQQAEKAPGFHATLFSAVYLIEAKEINPSGQWVTCESLPAGAFFFRGPHLIPTDKVAQKLGHDRKAFLEAGLRLGGEEIERGDACVELRVVPRIPVRLVLWLGDEEFSPRVTMLFDQLADEQVPLDALHSMTHLVVNSMLEAGDRNS